MMKVHWFGIHVIELAVGIVLGGFIAWAITRWYYRRSSVIPPAGRQKNRCP